MIFRSAIAAPPSSEADHVGAAGVVEAIQEGQPATPRSADARGRDPQDGAPPSGADQAHGQPAPAVGDVLEGAMAAEGARRPPGGGAAVAVLGVLAALLGSVPDLGALGRGAAG
jgi:hypothetical protein